MKRIDELAMIVPKAKTKALSGRDTDINIWLELISAASGNPGCGLFFLGGLDEKQS
jgi:hypothetical protein